MLVDASGNFITQREESRLCLVDAVLDRDRLGLSAPGQPLLSLQIPVQGNTCEVSVWEEKVLAIDCGDEAADWFNGFLNRQCRLVYMPDTSARQVDRHYAREGDKLGFADGFPVLLISEASLVDFNRHLNRPITMTRFRPNIVVSGCEAYAEDHWKSVQIGEINFDLVKPCSRCVIPSIDPATGKKNSEVSRQLARYRRREGNVYFGQNLVHRNHGMLRLGDRLTLVN